MKALSLTLLALFLSLAPTNANAKEQKEKSAAEQIFDLTNAEVNGITAARGAFQPVLDQFKAEGYKPEVIKDIEAAADAFFHQAMSDPSIKEQTIKLYEKHFNEDELNELLAFYRTPLGRKSLTKLPLITEESMMRGQKIAEKYAPNFQKQLMEILEKADLELELENKAAPAPTE